MARRQYQGSCTPLPSSLKALGLDERDLRVSVFPGRHQHPSLTSCGVRVEHAPSGLAAECDDSSSQKDNFASALRALAVRLNSVATLEG